jgi:uncharacterized protein (DUF3084 family)
LLSSPSATPCCPCCERIMTNDQEVAAFDDKMKWLIKESSFVHIDEDELQLYNALEKKYKDWRSALNVFLEDVRDFHRLTEEAKVLEQEMHEARDDSGTHQTSLARQKDQVKNLQSEVDDLRNLLDTSKRWAYDASRIKEKRLQSKCYILSLL